ncbi:hypothetical protein GFY24_18960 [Nocardia sp. SYP-A9097]|uniref:DUF6301 family protein n=1 Tax=Nocardia sp. SYP-A9097 TaxID=2663237 RepID=UPI00129B469B|nr:DUF6301 family protein [Nocardia sp. SYP-A9097]MRH89501.1 hypothetical protein [Nocardia sp. SYP-A9097]
MTEWRALTGSDVVDLAVRLRSLDWSWLLADVPALAADFGWAIGPTYRYSVSVGTELGPNTGSVSGRSETADEIGIRVTDFADDDAESRTRVRDAFADMASTITTVLGPPTQRIPGEDAEIRWAGAETTVRLRLFTSNVSLYLCTNNALDLEDQVTAMDEQGLL